MVALTEDAGGPAAHSGQRRPQAGFTDEELIHAKLNAIRVHVMDGHLVLVGPARSGDLLEIGYRPESDRIFHAINRSFL